MPYSLPQTSRCVGVWDARVLEVRAEENILHGLDNGFVTIPGDHD